MFLEAYLTDTLPPKECPTSIGSLTSNFFNNSEKMNNNPLSPSLSKEQNMDSVNGQVMQDLKVEDVFNVTQIKEIENGQIKNSNDNGF